MQTLIFVSDISHTLIKYDEVDRKNISLFGGNVEPIPKDGSS